MPAPRPSPRRGPGGRSRRSHEYRDGAGQLAVLLVERQELPVRREECVRTVAAEREVDPAAEADVGGILVGQVDARKAGPRGLPDRDDRELVRQLVERVCATQVEGPDSGTPQ